MAEPAQLPRRCFPALLVTLLALILTPAVAAQTQKGTVIRVGCDYTVAAGTRHAGTIVVFGGNISVEGGLQGRAIAIGGKAQVSGTVEGDVIALGGRVALLEGASLAGSVLAVGGGVERGADVDLRGPVNSISLAQGLRVPQFRFSPLQMRSFPVYSLYLTGLYLTVLIIGYLFPKQASRVDEALSAHPGRSVLVGLASIVLILPLTLAMVFTVIGLPLVLLMWLVFGTAKLLGYVAVVRVTGREIARRFGMRVGIPIHLAIGVVTLGLLRAVPFVGLLSGVLVLFCGLGAALRSRLGMGGPWFPTLARRRGASSH